MEIQELRIGNYYRWNSFKGEAEEDMTISTWNALDLMGFNGIYMDYMSHCFPIPLTEEWLEKFGFEYDIETKSYSILTHLEKHDYLFEVSNKYQQYFQPDFIGIDIKYVHQLQNLYFALTNEEL